MDNKISLAIFGSSENSLTVLKSLKKASFKIELVVTAPPRPVGRKQIMTRTPPHVFAEENGIPALRPEKLDETFFEEFRKYPLDVAIVADYARLIPKEVLEHPKTGCLNIHPSLLPKYRGSSPGEMAILAGDKVTGVSIIKMDDKFDHGPILSQFKEEIRDDDTSETLYQRLFAAGAQVLTTLLPAWVEGRIVPREQNHAKATLAPRLSRDDGFIPWELIKKAIQGENVSTENRPNKWKMVNARPERSRRRKWPIVIERAIRAFSPWPGIWTKVKVKSQKFRKTNENIKRSYRTRETYPRPSPIRRQNTQQLQSTTR